MHRSLKDHWRQGHGFLPFAGFWNANTSITSVEPGLARRSTRLLTSILMVLFLGWGNILSAQCTTPVISGNTSFCAGSSTTLSIPVQSGATYCWTSNSATLGWAAVGSAGFSADNANNTSLAFVGSTPYVAYSDGANGYKATVMKFNGTAWEVVGSPGFSGDVIESINLAMNGSTPYVVYTDQANGSKATVMKFNGTAWEAVGNIGFSADDAYYTRLAFAGSTPYVAFSDNFEDLSGEFTVMKFNGTAWETVGNAGFVTGRSIRLAINGGTPYVAYSDDDYSGSATVMKFNGTAWEVVGSAGFSAGSVSNPSLAFSDNIPYLAFTDGANDFKATVAKFNGTTWETVGGAGFSAGPADYIDLAIDGSTPYVAYQDNANDDKATVMKFNGTAWETAGTAAFSAGSANDISLAINGSSPYVAYRDIPNSSKATVMKLESCISNTNTLTVNAAGTYTVAVILGGCMESASQAVTVLAPIAYSVTGGGGYCIGAGVTVGLDGSETDVNYQLQIDGIDTGSPVAGTGSSISFGNQGTSGTYTVVATNTTNGCTASMTGAAVLAPFSASITKIQTSSSTASLTASAGDSYLWSTGATTNTISVGPGTYSVTVTNNSGPCTATASETVETIIFGEALHFDGADDFVNCGNDAPFQLSSGTLEAYINTSGAGSSFRGLIVKQLAFGLFLADNVLTVYDWTGGVITSATSNLADNTWHHVALTFDSGVTNGTKLYIDGVLVATTTITILDHNVPLVIGDGGVGQGQNFNGMMDEVRIWNVIRTEAEIQAGMNAEFCEAQTGLVAYYTFHQGIANADNLTVTTLTDLSGNNYSGALNNFALTGSTSNWVTPGSGVTPCLACVPTTEVCNNVDDDCDGLIDEDPFATPEISGATSFCAGGSTTLSVPALPGATYCWSSNTATPNWEAVGISGFSPGSAGYTDLDFDGGTPYVAFQDQAASGKASVMKFNGTSWEMVGDAGFSAGQALYTSLAFNGSTPYVAYRDGGNFGKVTLMKFNGSAWESVGTVGFSAGIAEWTSLAFDGNTPYVAFSDFGVGNKATVMKFNGTDWEIVGTRGFSTGTISYMNLVFSGSTPYVAFKDEDNNGKATVMKFNGTDWETVGGSGLSAGEANNLSFAFDGSTPAVSYQDFINDNKATVMKFNGTAWESVGNAGFTNDAVASTSLAFNAGTPYLAIADFSLGIKATVMKFNGTDWETVGNAGFSTDIAFYLNLVFNDNIPYVAYLDFGAGGKATVMKPNFCISNTNSLPVDASGTYTVTVNLGDCTVSASEEVIEIDNPTITDVQVTQPTCANPFGSIAVTASGNTDLEYSLTPGVEASWQTSNTFSNLPGRLYRPAVRSAINNGCVLLTGNAGAVTINRPITISGAITEPTCGGKSDATITAQVVGGVQPYTYVWGHGPTTRKVRNLSAGVYSVTVTDARGCTNSEEFVVAEPEPIVVTVDQSGTTSPITATIAASGGTPDYTYNISGTSTFVSSNVFTGLLPRAYSFRAKDANGCIGTIRVNLGAPAPLDDQATEERNVEATKVALTLFPNPTNRVLNIQLVDAEKLVTGNLTILNAFGQEVMNREIAMEENGASISVDYLPQGTYRLVFRNDDGTFAAEQFVILKD